MQLSPIFLLSDHPIFLPPKKNFTEFATLRLKENFSIFVEANKRTIQTTLLLRVFDHSLCGVKIEEQVTRVGTSSSNNSSSDERKGGEFQTG